MNPLVYYYVPQAYMEKSACVLEWNREEWVEIRLVDSETIYENKSLKEKILTSCFVDQAEDLAQFLWKLKEPDERLEVQQGEKKSQRGGQNPETERELETILDQMSIHRCSYEVVYLTGAQVRKIAFIDGVALHLFVKKECQSIEDFLTGYASPGDYRCYELGEKSDEMQKERYKLGQIRK